MTSKNGIINGPRQRDEELAEDVGPGHLADKAKREEYERLMRQKKKTPPANEASEVRN